MSQHPTVQVEPISAEEAKANRTALYGWLTKFQDLLLQNPGACLVSRRDEDQLWRQTGFLIEGGVVSAKLGEHHYQPIGLDRDGGFYPTQGSKILWANEFSIAVMTPFKPPFEVTKVEKAGPVDSQAPGALTDRERAMLEANFKDLKTIHDAYSAAMAEGDETKIKAANADVLDGLRLACIQCPKLDQKLTEFSIKNPELGLQPDLTGNVTPIQLFQIATEWIRMKLNDDSQRRHYDATKLVASGDVTQLQLAELALHKLNYLLSTVDTIPDMGIFKALLEQIMACFPVVDEALGEYKETSDLIAAAKRALPVMEKLVGDLKALTPLPAEAAPEALPVEPAPETPPTA